ncbi:MAG TPA: hypothetical protein VF081_08815 [Solirubrobacterales bacterium]
MNRHKAIVGLCMLCALLFSAFAAQSASAITGTTAFTCKKNAAPEDRRGEHCLNEGTAPKEYGHVPIAENTTTELIASNAKTLNNTAESSVIKLRLTVAGIPVELQATGLSGSGWIENKKAASGEHYSHTKGTTTFTGVTVTEPKERGCKVYTHKEDGSGNPGEEGEVGVIHTKELTGTTEGQGDNFKFTPAAGEVFANFWLTCTTKVEACEGTWSIVGSVKGQPNGTTSTLNHATTTAENTLKGRGAKAGFDGNLTISAREKGSGGAFIPLAETTVTT